MFSICQLIRGYYLALYFLYFAEFRTVKKIQKHSWIMFRSLSNIISSKIMVLYSETCLEKVDNSSMQMEFLRNFWYFEETVFWATIWPWLTILIHEWTKLTITICKGSFLENFHILEKRYFGQIPALCFLLWNMPSQGWQQQHLNRVP